MTEKRRGFVSDAPLADVTYQVIGLAMATHNELGPGYREVVYHTALAYKLSEAGLHFEVEPYVSVTLPDGSVVGGACPDLLVEEDLIVELKAHTYAMTPGEAAQVISYFAAFERATVALYLNFGHERLEFRRLFPPRALQTFKTDKSKPKG